MSLLLDALKRAEQEKQARPPERPGPTGKPTLELAPLATAGAAAAARAAASTPTAPPPSARAEAPARSRKIFWIAGAAIAVVILVAAGYVWYSIAALTPQASARAPSPRPVVAAPSPTAAPAATPPAAPLAKIEPPVEAPKARAPEMRPASSAESPSRNVAPAPAMLQPARAADRARIAPQVASGYEALRAGDLATARRDYSAALAADAGNLDATLGLATVEARSGRTEAAFPLYRRALEIDPRNPTALAALAALSDPARAETLEQQLLRDIAQNPNAASLHHMLGNVYASQALWTQAQAAYYEAHRLDPGNPDVLHNLAVSLDRIGQPRLAATMYRRALDASRTQASQINAAAVEKRLAEIEATTR